MTIMRELRGYAMLSDGTPDDPEMQARAAMHACGLSESHAAFHDPRNKEAAADWSRRQQALLGQPNIAHQEFAKPLCMRQPELERMHERNLQGLGFPYLKPRYRVPAGRRVVEAGCRHDDKRWWDGLDEGAVI